MFSLSPGWIGSNEYDSNNREYEDSSSLSNCAVPLQPRKTCLENIRILLLEIQEMVKLFRLAQVIG